MSVNEPSSSPPIANSPDELSQLLEIELIQKRAEWQRTTARNKSLKSVSIFFLFVVVLAALGAVFYAMTRAGEGKQHRAEQTVVEPAQP